VSGVVALAGCTGNGGDGNDGGGDGGDGGDGGGDGGGSPTPGSSGDEEVTIQWMTWPQGPVDAFEEAMHEAGLPDRISIEIVPGGQSTSEFRNKQQQTLQAGRATPDILQMDSAWMYPFVQSERVVNLSEVLPDQMLAEVKEHYAPSLQHVFGRKDLSPDGDLYGIPKLADYPEILYRKDLVEEAGYDPEGENWATEGMTWQRLSQIAADVSGQTNTKHGFITRLSANGLVACCFFQELLSGWDGAYFGGNTLGNVGDRPVTVDEEPALNALRMLRTFIYGYDDEHSLPEDSGYAEQIMPRTALQWSIEPARKTFDAGDAVFMRHWPYSIPIEHGTFGDNLGLMPDPWVVPQEDAEIERPRQTLAALGGWNNTINPNTEYMDEAVEFLKAFHQPEPQLQLFEQAGYLPPRQDVLQMAADSPDRFGAMGGYVDTLQVAAESAVSYPQSQVWTRQSQRITQQVHAVLKQEASPEDGMADLKSQLTQLEDSV
jgi:ABC-type glycerol-3-phosphate transport system substrate-binding protein